MAKILVIDDDEIVNDMIVQLLAEAGYEVCGASDGVHGMKLFEASPFDLIITDIVMPEKEGIETILAIRAKSKTVPIIAISGGGKLGPDQYLSLARKVGANFLFKKPFENPVFLDAVQQCLALKDPETHARP
ncbi:MAG TPA: response regulator [Bacteroidota bacterium]|nr:response regulator [Bacteroidota bacterium]